MSSSQYGRQAPEVDTAKDGTSTETLDMNTDNGQFHPGPSFLDYDRPDVRMVQLPAWLQTFAATVGEPGEEWPEPDADATKSLREDEPPASARPGDEVEDRLSSWLDEDEAEAPNGATPANGSAVDPAFMISEDDLPEWLRSIAPGEGGDALGGAAEGGSGGIRIPAVSRAWVPETDQAAPADESASVFALLASQGPQAALPGAGEHDVERDQFHALEQAGPALANVPGQKPGARGDRSRTGSAADGDASPGQASRLLPILAGAALLLLVLLIVIFLL